MCRKKSTVFCASACLAKPATVWSHLAMAPPKPAPGLTHVADDQPDHEREGRDDLEIDQRLDADAADFLGILDMRDAGHHGAEDDRRDHHLDQLDEAVAERLDPIVGGIVPATASRPARRARSRSAPEHRESCTRASPRLTGAPVAIVVAVITFTPLKDCGSFRRACAARFRWLQPKSHGCTESMALLPAVSGSPHTLCQASAQYAPPLRASRRPSARRRSE